MENTENFEKIHSEQIDVDAAFNVQIKNIFLRLAMMLLITAATILVIGMSQTILIALFSHMWVYTVICIAQLGIVFLMSSSLYTLSNNTLTALSIGYSILTGATLSIVVLFNLEAAILAFMITIILFIIMGTIGYVTNKPIYRAQNILYGTLLAVVIASFANLFIKLPILDLGIVIVGIILFCGYIVYDINRIKMETVYMLQDQNGLVQEEVMSKIAQLSALHLYLDIVNLFLYILRLLSRRRD